MLTQGIHDIPMSAYLADPCPEPALSTTTVQLLVERSPRHAWLHHPRLGNGDRDESSRADLGSAAHARLLGGDRAIVVVDAEDWRTKEARKQRDDAREAGLIPVLAKDEESITAMHGEARRVLDTFGEGTAEQTLLWQDSKSGVWCKSRPDWLSASRELVVDYKTASTADPGSWIASALYSGGYDLQAALVLRGLEAILGEAQREFVFLVQEIDPPYLVSRIALGPDAIDLANRKVGAACRIWAECLRTNTWPGYDERIHWADSPAWRLYDWESRSAAYSQQAGKP